MEPQKIYVSLKAFAEEYRRTGWITFNSIRRVYREREKNGFSPAFKKIGKRVLVDVNKFWDIVDKKGDK